jgi:cytochrome subunit of sulfide dehydrogenase
MPHLTCRAGRPGRRWRPSMAGLAALLCATGPVLAKDPAALRTRALAATCAQCHGTDGHAVQGEALIRLAGLPQDYILTQLMAFRSGQRSATIMHQITRGYSQEQLETLAVYFSAQK